MPHQSITPVDADQSTLKRWRHQLVQNRTEVLLITLFIVALTVILLGAHVVGPNVAKAEKTAS